MGLGRQCRCAVRIQSGHATRAHVHVGGRPRFRGERSSRGSGRPEPAAGVSRAARCARRCRRQCATARDGQRLQRDRRRWALLGSVGWQDWSQFGEAEIGMDSTQTPPASATGCRFRIPGMSRWAPSTARAISGKWTSASPMTPGFQDGNDVSPLFPVNSAWRLGAGGEKQASDSFKWGFTTALLYGGNIDVDKRSTLPPVLGGRGNLVGVVRPDAVRRTDRIRQLGPVTARHPAAQVER